MKKRMISGAIIALLVCNVSMGANPTSSKTDKAATSMVSKLNADVTLTAQQKETLMKKAKQFQENLEKARAISDKEEATAFMQEATQELKTSIDSTLTIDQKKQKESKEAERENRNRNGSRK
ncbi:MAG: hypothetical protein PHV20_03535 [Bacteroidales bacterium]|nr:hypothetical protein [Bacteroidales bacterium]